MTNNTSSEQPSFEAAMKELEDIVQAMEQGDLPLEEALTKFERGIHLVKSGQEKLKNAEQKVQMLMQKAGQQELVDFQPDGE
ncbi:MAG: exodeoxyribonuclease VII small subunit [Aestuariibacter sp.]